MMAIRKGRFVMALLGLSMVTPMWNARSADALSRTLSPASSPHSGVGAVREPRALSRQEIFQAIQDDLDRMGVSGREQLRPGDLTIQSSVPALKIDTGLKVKRIAYDPVRRETVFELWASHEPRYLPFAVTTRRDPQGLGLTSRPGWKRADARGEPGSPLMGVGVRRAGSKPPILAKPGRPATLVMLGQNVRITTTVVPLQPGSKGQRILVRDLATARVMAAEVVAEGLLQTSF